MKTNWTDELRALRARATLDGLALLPLLLTGGVLLIATLEAVGVVGVSP
jgi:uncharacterized protein GlcG (DUF336 family)